jgi:hypothetical protein
MTKTPSHKRLRVLGSGTRMPDEEEVSTRSSSSATAAHARYGPADPRMTCGVANVAVTLAA